MMDRWTFIANAKTACDHLIEELIRAYDEEADRIDVNLGWVNDGKESDPMMIFTGMAAAGLLGMIGSMDFPRKDAADD